MFAARGSIVRSPSGPPTVEIELMIAEGDGRRVVGQVIPPEVVEVELVGGQTGSATTTDHLGRFTFDDPPTGPAQLVIRDGSGAAMAQTSWLLL